MSVIEESEKLRQMITVFKKDMQTRLAEIHEQYTLVLELMLKTLDTNT